MTEATAGLIGVFVGGFLSGGFQWFFRMTDIRDRRRGALRIVLFELTTNLASIKVAAEFGIWWSAAKLKREAADKYFAELAHVFRNDYKKWDELQNANSIVSVAETLRDKAEKLAVENGFDKMPRLTIEELEVVKFCRDGLEHAVAMLDDRPSTGEAAVPNAD